MTLKVASASARQERNQGRLSAASLRRQRHSDWNHLPRVMVAACPSVTFLCGSLTYDVVFRHGAAVHVRSSVECDTLLLRPEGSVDELH